MPSLLSPGYASLPARFPLPHGLDACGFHGKLAYDPGSLAIMSANDDAGAFFGRPGAGLLGRTITSLTWPEPVEGVDAGTGGDPPLQERFRSQSYWQERIPVRPSADGEGLLLCIEAEPLQLGDRPLILISLRLEAEHSLRRREDPSFGSHADRPAPRSATEAAQNYIMRAARCLIWQAQVHHQEDGRLHWEVAPVSEEAAQEFLPLEVPPGGDYWWALTDQRLDEDRDRIDRHATESLLAHRNYSQDYRQVNKYGEIRWLHEDVHVEPIAPGLWHCIGVCTDITELKRAQEVQQYVARSARCLLWYADVSEFDPRQESILRWDIHPLTNETGQDFIPLEQHPGESYLAAMYRSRKRANEDLPRIHRCGTDSLRADRDFSQEFCVFDANGDVRWLREDISVERVGPDRWRCVGVCTDITEMKHAAKEREGAIQRVEGVLGELRHLVTRARCMLWHATVEVRPILDAAWDCLRYDEIGETYLHWEVTVLESEAVSKWLPLAPTGRSFADAWRDACLPDDQEKIDRNAHAALRSGKTSYSQEYRCRMADRTVRWLKEDVHIEPQAEGRWLAVGVCTDVTEAKRLQAQLIQTEKMASLGQLVAGVAHEINNPLSVVSAVSEILQTHRDPQVRQDGATIRSMCRRTNRVVQALRTFARDGHADALSPGSVNDCVKGILDIVGHQLRQSEVTLTLDLSPDLPLAPMNANQIQQVILNLVGNAEYAVRARPVDERAIRIITRLHDGGRGEEASRATAVSGTAGGATGRTDGGKYVSLSVQDTGNGIPKAIADRLFDPFFTTKEVGQGTGLGLSICHGIVQAHGGMLRFESREGEGTTFTLALPLS